MARAIIEHSREVWLAADHSKFNRPAMVELARLDEIDMLFTDAAAAGAVPELLAEAGVQLRRPASEPPMTGQTPTSLALDQGTSSSRSIVFDARRAASSRWRSASSARSTRSRAGSSTTRARSGQTQLATAREALAKAGLARRRHRRRSASPTSARPRWCGTARTGEPIYNAIVWQDRRTEPTCAALRAARPASRCSASKTGLVLDAYFSGTKLAVDPRQRARRARARPSAASSPSAPSTAG